MKNQKVKPNRENIRNVDTVINFNSCDSTKIKPINN